MIYLNRNVRCVQLVIEIVLINLDSKKARGCALKPWSLLHQSSLSGGMVRLYASARQFFQGQAVH
jgi:hypothetical protein